jgi:glucose-1-phosphate thymidylyltransferase
MTALVLAAGYATRLYPYTRHFPKALLKVEGRPLLGRLLEKLAEVREIGEVVLITNRLFFGLFSRWREERGRPEGQPALTLLEDGTTGEGERRGGVGDLCYAIERAGLTEDLLVVSSDRLFGFSFQPMVQAFLRRGEPLNACYDTGDPQRIRGRHGCLQLAPDGRVLDFQEKPAHPRSSIASVALTLLPARHLDLPAAYLAEGGNPDAPGYLLEWLHRRVPLYGWCFREPSPDVGSLSAWWQANRRVVEANGMLAALVVDHAPFEDPQRLRAELLRSLRTLEAEDRLYLATVLTDEKRFEVYEQVLREHPPRFPVAFRGRAGPLDLERAGVLSNWTMHPFHLIAWIQARPDWPPERSPDAGSASAQPAG